MSIIRRASAKPGAGCLSSHREAHKICQGKPTLAPWEQVHLTEIGVEPPEAPAAAVEAEPPQQQTPAPAEPEPAKQQALAPADAPSEAQAPPMGPAA